MRVFVCQCTNEVCGWYGILEECSVFPADHERPTCPSCGEDVESRQVDFTPFSFQNWSNFAMYRLLEKGDKLQKDDEYWWWNSGKWSKINPDTIGCVLPMTEFESPFRRKSQPCIHSMPDVDGSNDRSCGKNGGQVCCYQSEEVEPQ